jgi:hypothetical protein
MQSGINISETSSQSVSIQCDSTPYLTFIAIQTYLHWQVRISAFSTSFCSNYSHQKWLTDFTYLVAKNKFSNNELKIEHFLRTFRTFEHFLRTKSAIRGREKNEPKLLTIFHVNVTNASIWFMSTNRYMAPTSVTRRVGEKFAQSVAQTFICQNYCFNVYLGKKLAKNVVYFFNFWCPK